MSNILVSALGLGGAFLSLFAYFQVSHGKWHGKSWRFQSCNAVAAVLLIYYGWQTKAYANILLNLVWLIIALAALKRFGKKA